MKDFKNKRVIFMGTPEFSVPVLTMLVKQTDVVLCVTKPDKEVGRGHNIKFSPIKELAIKNNIEVFQPVKIKNDFDYILSFKSDLIVTCAYGQIIPKKILDSPHYGCINVHASLLPKLRGGAPIHRAIINGEKETGITIMYMNEKMDEGNIISSSRINIQENDNVGTLHDKLSILGSELLQDTLKSIFNNTNKSVPQNHNDATYGYNISKEDEHICFNKTSLEVYNQIRGLYPFPGGYIILNNQIVKVCESYIGDIDSNNPGVIEHIYKNGIGVGTLDKEIVITKLKKEGKKEMNARDFINGTKNELIGCKVL